VHDLGRSLCRYDEDTNLERLKQEPSFAPAASAATLSCHVTAAAGTGKRRSESATMSS
jgi:hypothetical protein